MTSEGHAAKTHPYAGHARALPAWAGRLAWLAYWLLAAGSSLWVLRLFLAVSGVGASERATFEGLIEWTAWRPYVYRTLLPSLVHFLRALVPPGLVDLARNVPYIDGLLMALHVETYQAEALLMLAGQLGSLLAFVAAFRLLIRAVGPDHPRWLLELTPLATLFILPIGFAAGYYYDFPSLATFTLALALLAAGRWPGYLAAFALATLSKETSLFLIPIYLAYYAPRLERRAFLALAAAQAVLYALIKGGLTWAFRNNPGGLVEVHLLDHLKILREFPIPVLVALALCAGVAALALAGWRGKPLFLRLALGLSMPPMVGLYFLFGFPFEIRVFYELFPVIVLLSGMGAASLLRPRRVTGAPSTGYHFFR